MTVHIEILEVLNGTGYIIYQNCSPAFKTKVMKLNTTIMFIFFGYLLFRTVLLALEVKTLKDKCAKLEHNISQNYNDYKELDSIFMNQVIPMSYRIGWTDGRNSNSTFKADSIKFEKDIHKCKHGIPACFKYFPAACYFSCNRISNDVADRHDCRIA